MRWMDRGPELRRFPLFVSARMHLLKSVILHTLHLQGFHLSFMSVHPLSRSHLLMDQKEE